MTNAVQQAHTDAVHDQKMSLDMTQSSVLKLDTSMPKRLLTYIAELYMMYVSCIYYM